jgi:hypothetical protein
MAQNVEYRYQNMEYREKKNGKWGEWKRVSIVDDAEMMFHCKNKVIPKIKTLSCIAEKFDTQYNIMLSYLRRRDREKTHLYDSEIEKIDKKLNELKDYWVALIHIDPKEDLIDINYQILTYYKINDEGMNKWDYIEKNIINRLIEKSISHECTLLNRIKFDFPLTYNAITNAINYEHVHVKNDFLDFDDSINSISWMFKSTKCNLPAKDIYPYLLRKGKPIDEGTFNNGYYSNKEPVIWKKSRKKYKL